MPNESKLMKTNAHSYAYSVKRARRDDDLMDQVGNARLIDELAIISQRASSTIDDAVNTVASSEERLAAYEAQAMR